MTFRHRHFRLSRLIETVEFDGERSRANTRIKRRQRSRYNGAEKEAVYFSLGGKLHGRRMDARSCLAPRSVAKDPSGLSTGIVAGDEALDVLCQKMSQAAHRRRSR